MDSSYAIYERVGMANARDSGFPSIPPELEVQLCALGDNLVVKVLRLLDPLMVDSKETISGRGVYQLLGYSNYFDFVRTMFKGYKGKPGVVPLAEYQVVQMESTGGRPATDHLLTADGFIVAAMASDTAIGHTVRSWAIGVKNAFARLAANHNKEAVAALRASMAAAEAHAVAAAAEIAATAAERDAAIQAKGEAEEAYAGALDSLAAAVARVKRDPLTLDTHMPKTVDGNYRENKDFKRLTRASAYLFVDTLYAAGVRCANVYTDMIMGTTNVCVMFPAAEVSNIVATTGLQRAMKECIRRWTGTEPAYSTDMTTEQLFTFAVRYADWYVDYCKKQLLQTTLDGGVVPKEQSVPMEIATWIDGMLEAFPGMRPLPAAKTVQLEDPLADRDEQLRGQTQLDVYVQRGKLGRKRKAPAEPRGNGGVSVNVVVISDESGSE